MKEGGLYAAWALKIGMSHAGRETWCWHLMPLCAIKSIWRDCWRLTQFAEPFDVPGDAMPPLLPKQRTWDWLVAAAPDR